MLAGRPKPSDLITFNKYFDASHYWMKLDEPGARKIQGPTCAWQVSGACCTLRDEPRPINPFWRVPGWLPLRPLNEWALWSKPESGYRRSNWRTFVVRRRRLQAQHASAQPSGHSFAPRAHIQDGRFDVRPRADLASRDPRPVPRGTPPTVRYEFGSFARWSRSRACGNPHTR